MGPATGGWHCDAHGPWTSAGSLKSQALLGRKAGIHGKVTGDRIETATRYGHRIIPLDGLGSVFLIDPVRSPPRALQLSPRRASLQSLERTKSETTARSS